MRAIRKPSALPAAFAALVLILGMFSLTAGCDFLQSTGGVQSVPVATTQPATDGATTQPTTQPAATSGDKVGEALDISSQIANAVAPLAGPWGVVAATILGAVAVVYRKSKKKTGGGG